MKQLTPLVMLGNRGLSPIVSLVYTLMRFQKLVADFINFVSELLPKTTALIVIKINR